jgi:hypothetical protein
MSTLTSRITRSSFRHLATVCVACAVLVACLPTIAAADATVPVLPDAASSVAHEVMKTHAETDKGDGFGGDGRKN